MEIRPQEAARKLMENAKKIEEMTEKIIEARTDATMAEAVYLDAKREAWKATRSESATAAQQIISYTTTDEKKALSLAECGLKNLQDRLRVLDTANNNFKMAIKLMELEIKNLNLQ